MSLTKTDRHGRSTLNSGRSGRNGDLIRILALDALLNGARRHKFGYESSDLFGRILRAVVPGARQAKHLAVRERLAEQRKELLGTQCPVGLAPDCQRRLLRKLSLGRPIGRLEAVRAGRKADLDGSINEPVGNLRHQRLLSEVKPKVLAPEGCRPCCLTKGMTLDQINLD